MNLNPGLTIFVRYTLFLCLSGQLENVVFGLDLIFFETIGFWIQRFGWNSDLCLDLKKLLDLPTIGHGPGRITITNSDLNRPCFARHPY